MQNLTPTQIVTELFQTSKAEREQFVKTRMLALEAEMKASAATA